MTLRDYLKEFKECWWGDFDKDIIAGEEVSFVIENNRDFNEIIGLTNFSSLESIVNNNDWLGRCRIASEHSKYSSDNKIIKVLYVNLVK